MIKKITVYVLLPLFVLIIIIREISHHKFSITSPAPLSTPALITGIHELAPGTYRVVKHISRIPTAENSNTVKVIIEIEDSAKNSGNSQQIFWIQPADEKDDYSVGDVFQKLKDRTTIMNKK